MREMKTDEEGNIEQNRRINQNMSKYSIVNEILGNLYGSVISWNYIKETKKLYIFVNDGGLSKDDKTAITQKYKSGGSNNTAGVNGIGIRQAMDRISTSDKVILRTINESVREKMEFFFYKDKPSWQIQDEWSELNETDIKEYNKVCVE